MSDAYVTMLGVALRRAGRHGNGGSSRRNKRIDVSGRYVPLWTFVKMFHRVQGVVTCYYYNQPIFAIDFINARLTNFYMSNYSVSTSANIRGWEGACQQLFTLPPSTGHYSAWMSYPPPRGDLETAYLRFSARIPWIYDDPRTKTRWFQWDRYDDQLAKTYHASSAFLREDQNWRYFKYDWNEEECWRRHFIDASAERRWNQRERTRARKARKRTA